MAITEEKVELIEQPLAAATDVSGTAETTKPEDFPPLSEATKKQKWWFKKNNKKTVTDVEKPIEKEADGVDANEANVKKPRWWQPKCKATSAEGTTFGLDYAQRDEQRMHAAIDLSFGDIFSEPDALHSWNAVWRITHSIFTGVRNFFYKLFTILIFVPAALIFGFLFALVSAIGVFVVFPAGRLLSIPTAWLFMLWSYVVVGLLEPLSSGIAGVFSRIKVYRYGINNDPTATMGV